MKRNHILVNYWHIFVFLFCFILLTQICKIVYTTYYDDSLDNENRKLLVSHNSDSNQNKIDFKGEITTACVRLKDIEELIEFFENSDRYLENVNKKDTCQKVSRLINMIYEIDLINNSEKIIIPKPMEKLVKEKWLGNDPELFEKFLSPKTLTLTNRWTFETTGINPLRALRPRQNSNDDSLQYTLNLINTTKSGCNFCNKEYMSIDSFGRIENQNLNLYSAHNSFPYTDFVGIFIPEKLHNWMKVIM